MATSFFIRTKKIKDTVFLSVRVQDPKKALNIRQSTCIRVDIEDWTKATKSRVAMTNYRKRHPELWGKLDEIKRELDSCLSLHPEVKITPERVSKIVDEIYNAERYAKERAEAQKAQRVTFMDYYKRFLSGMRCGTIKNDKGLEFSNGTYRRFNLGYNRLCEYQQYRGIKIDFADITPDFIADYTHFLQHIEELWPDRDERNRNQAASNYSLNTVGTRLKELKYILNRYAKENRSNPFVDVTEIRESAEFKAKNTFDSDSVYLTENELEAFKNADISTYPKGYEYARDLFLVGCYTAQRVSDYAHIKKENIKRREVIRVKDGREIIEERLVIELRQQKTGARVIIPVKAELREILEKYDYQLPELSDQKINEYIKTIAKIAGINEPTTIHLTKGGKESEEVHPKWELIVSHTARRTGATLMYLSGMEAFDIMRITGHSTPAMLEKYIKANQLEVGEKLVKKYDYFK